MADSAVHQTEPLHLLHRHLQTNKNLLQHKNLLEIKNLERSLNVDSPKEDRVNISPIQLSLTPAPGQHQQLHHRLLGHQDVRMMSFTY